MDDRQFKELLDWFGLCWDGYHRVRKGVKKRIRRHMQVCGCRNVHDYLSKLAYDEALKKQCRALLAVSISRFFRDCKIWQTLAEEILPALTSGERDRIAVWSAGCARGEEIYSFKILWNEMRARCASLPKLEVWATDMNQEYIEAAQEGVYSASSLKETPDELQDKYFKRLPKTSFFAVRDSVKQGICWRRIDLLKDPPPADDFHMIFLRNNLLTYYRKTLVYPAFLKVVETLVEGGYLIIGSKEKLPAAVDQFRSYPGHSSIFVKKRATQSSQYPGS